MSFSTLVSCNLRALIVFQVVFQPHYGNPNLIAIIPEGTSPPVRQTYFRPAPPRQQHFRPANTIGNTLKLLPQVQIGEKDSASSAEKRSQEENEEGNAIFV